MTINQKSETPMETGPERLFSVDETADLLALSHWTIRDWIKLGKMESHKLGGRRLIARSEIERLLNESRKPATRELSFA